MVSSFSAELLKLRKRPAVWILGLVLLALVMILGYFVTYSIFSNPPEPPEGAPPRAQQQEQLAETQLQLLYPQNIPANVATAFSATGGAGAIALILGAMAMGSEYGWDTLKTVLPRRPERLGFLSGKFIGIGIVLLVFVILTFIAAAISSYVIASLENASVEWPVVEILESVGAGILIMSVWAALGALLALLFRGTALAIGLGLVYYLAVEGILFNLPGQNDFLEDAQKYFPGQNSNFLSNSFAPESLPQGFGPQEPPVDPGQAALVLGVYLVVFVGISLLIFRRRDIA